MTLRVFDERDPAPVRARIGRLLASSHSADFAVARIRLAALDLQGSEVETVGRCRVLLGTFDASTLHETVEGGSRPMLGERGVADRLGRLQVLRQFIGSGRLEVRSAGLAGWIPDFSVFRGDAAVALLGAHHFGAPYPLVGPSFTAESRDPDVVALTSDRFEDLWEHGHDVLPAIHSVVQQAYDTLDISAAAGGGDPDPA